jgi:hypothetical protein
MELQQVPASFVDRAWSEGASALAKACAESGGEVTGDQLKLLCARGERHLIRMVVDGEVVGWGVLRVDQLPNMRVLHICELYAPNGGFERFFTAVKEMAASLGCSRVRCAAKPAQARLYRMKAGFQPVYEILEVCV